MRLTYTTKTAWRSIRSNVSRSLLTVLGIVIGITAIILIVSIGEGTQRLIVGEIQGLGANTIIIRPGKQPSGPTDVAGTLFADSLKNADVEALQRKENVPDLIAIAPALIITGNASHGAETYRPTIFGWDAEFMGSMMDVVPVKGEYFDETDIRAKASVAVIGSKVAKELFLNEDPVGKTIKIKNHAFRVVAVLPPKGQSAFFNVDEVVVVPYTTAQTYVLGIDYYNEVMVRVANSDVVDESVYDITATLRERHNITDPTKDDFFVVTQQSVVDQISVILNILTLFLSSVVAISLVVGGIGVMNIMLVSVTERTREIGLRKALGAHNRDILLQFLIEAVLLTGAGGVIGIILGTAFSYLAGIGVARGLSVSWEFVFPYMAAVEGVGVSAAVGLIFGIYPARKASKKSPIEALRYE